MWETVRAGDRENLFAKKVSTIKHNTRITKYNGRLPEGVLIPSKLVAYVNLDNQIKSNNEGKTKKAKITEIINPFNYHYETY